MAFPDRSTRVETARSLEPNVEKDDIGPGALDGYERGGHVFGLPHDLHLGDVLKHGLQPLAHHLVVIDQHHPYRLGHARTSAGVGTRTVTTVPWPGLLRTESSPPMS